MRAGAKGATKLPLKDNVFFLSFELPTLFPIPFYRRRYFCLVRSEQVAIRIRVKYVLGYGDESMNAHLLSSPAATRVGPTIEIGILSARRLVNNRL